MSFDSIIGQPLAVDLCRTWLKRQTTHPLLFYGPEGVGKKTLALVTAKMLNCSAKTANPCGSCIACRKSFPESIRMSALSTGSGRRRNAKNL